MRCPKCSCQDDKVIDSRSSREGLTIRRRRECVACEHRYTTYEHIERPRLMVVKRDSRIEEFSRAKLTSGIEKACQKRPVIPQSIEDVVERIVEDLSRSFDREVPVGEITVELLGDAAKSIEPHVIEQAAQAVLHYFRAELGRTQVSVAEFTTALETALRGLGFDIAAPLSPSPPPAMSATSTSTPATLGVLERVVDADLCGVAVSCGDGFELVFFQHLREEFRRHMAKSPQVLRFRGLRGCVQHLTGSKRWTQRCDLMQDQIVEYLRSCLTTDARASSCSLVVF